MLRRALIYGGLAALMTSAWTLGEFALGFHGERAEIGRYSGFLAIVFPVIAIVLALRAARHVRGRLQMRDALAEGMAVSLVLAVLGALFIWCYFAWINPDFREAGRALDPVGQAVMVLLSSLAAGLVISTIAGLVLRRESGTE